MRGLLFASLMCAVFASAAMAQAYGGSQGSAGQHQGQQGGGQRSGGQGGRNGQNDSPPPPPPIPRCPDLSIGSYGYVTAIPGQAPLAADEIAIQFEVRNAGTASYVGAPSAQSLTLGYTTPGGAHQVASVALPPAAGQAAAHAAQLGPHESWSGYMRATLSPADRRWPLHLKVAYGASAFNGYGLANDCNTDNNEIVLARP